MKKIFFYIITTSIILGAFTPVSLTLTNDIKVKKNVISADDCSVVSAGWNPAGEQDKDSFFREGVTGKIIFKTKNCVGVGQINLSIYEADTCPFTNCDNQLTDSGLWRRIIDIPSDNFAVNLKLGEEKCEAGATGAVGYDCDLYFTLRQGDNNLYESKNQSDGRLYYECDGACDINAQFLGISKLGSDGNPESDTVININAQKAKDIDNTYKLLAPIGGFSEIKTNGGGTCPGNPDIPNGVGCYLNIIFKIGIGLCGALAVIMIVIAGIQYMGTESIFGKTEAKSKILSAIMGLFIALGAYAILNTIDPNLTGKNGVTVDQVSVEIDEEEESEPVTTYYQVTGTTKLCTTGYKDVITYGTPKKINVCVSVGGIPVADKLQSMINDAQKSGIILSGYGARSYDRQVELRKQHGCKPDIYTSPAKSCKPPTARPGHSNHEVGGAVDFTCNGQSMVASGGRNSPCFKWLASNASKYNFKNLASESWHWSFNGK